MGVGAVAGGLIGSGVGLLAAPAATATAVSSAAGLISAGTAATITGGNYIARNPKNFESKPFVGSTAISAVTAYLTSQPGTSGWKKLFLREAAAEATYLLNADNPNLTDAAAVAVGAFAAHGTSEFLTGALTPTIQDGFLPAGTLGQNVFPGQGIGNNILNVAISQRRQEAIMQTTSSLFNGVITAGMNIYARGRARKFIEK